MGISLERPQTGSAFFSDFSEVLPSRKVVLVFIFG